MARRNLLAEAQVTAAAQIAPQQAALEASLSQAIADRNSAIHAAATAYHGLSGAIHRAGPQVRKVYSGAQKSAAGTDAIAKKTLGGLASSPGVDTVKAAYAHEGAVGGAVVAKALASRLADLSDRRIAAAAGRAYSTVKANTDYSAAAATLAEKRSALAQQQGLLTGAAYSKLEEAAAGRKNQRLMQQRSLASAQNLAAEKIAADQSAAAADRAFKHHESAVGRKFTAGQNAAKLRAAGKKTPANTSKSANASASFHTQVAQAAARARDLKGSNDPKTIRHYLVTGLKTPNVTIPAAKDVDAVNAGVELATQGYLSPSSIKTLQARGIQIPKGWTPVQVRPHTRKRKGQ